MRQAVTLTREKRTLKKGVVEYWTLRWYDQQGNFRSKSLGRTDKVSERQAKKLKRQKENDFDSRPGLRNIGQSITLKDFFEDYFDSRQHELAARTLKLYRHEAMYLMAHFGEGRRLDQISRHDAMKFKSALANGKLEHHLKRKSKTKAISVNTFLCGIRSMFNTAVGIDLIKENPFSKLVKKIKISKPWHYVSCIDLSALSEAAFGQYQLLFALCRLAALRKEEALFLSWDDIDWTHGRLRIVGKDYWQPKSRTERTIPICPELQVKLLNAYEKAQDGAVRVFKTVADDRFYRELDKIFKRSKVARWDKPLHSMRKSCITDWAKKYPMHTVQQWCGHKSILTTREYYLQVSDSEYDMAASDSFWTEKVVTQDVTQNVNA